MRKYISDETKEKCMALASAILQNYAFYKSERAGMGVNMLSGILKIMSPAQYKETVDVLNKEFNPSSICYKNGDIAGDRCCQDWNCGANIAKIEPDTMFTEEEKDALTFNSSVSDISDYDKDCYFFNDEMSVSFTIGSFLEDLYFDRLPKAA